MIGPVSTAEKERLTTLLGRDRCLRRRSAGYGENTEISLRIKLAAAADAALHSAVGTMTGTSPRIVAMAVERARTELASISGVETAVTLLLCVPEDMPESTVREFLRVAYEASAFEEVNILRERREEVLAHVSAFGEKEPNDSVTDTGASEEWFIVMAGVAGIEGTVLLYEANREQIEETYPKHFLQKVAELPELAAGAKLIRTGLENGAVAVVPGGDGGVYGALWRLGEKFRVGMKVTLTDIPIAQITIEVCEVTDRDPYQIPGGGCVLFVTAEPERLIAALSEAAPKVEAEVIGRLTKDAARTIENRGETRYLEPYRGG